MRSFKMPERLDRPTFWMYVVPLVIGHVILALLAAHGSGLAGADLVVVTWLALVVGSRFRDIGWRPWIGVSFVLVTVVALPLAALAIAIAVNPGRALDGVSAIGLVTGPLNLLLIAVAGSVPGTVPLEKLVIPFGDAQKTAGEPDSETAHPTAVPLAVALRSTYVRPRAWEIAGGVVVVVILGAAAASLVLRNSTPTSPAISVSTPPRASSYATVRPPGDPPATNAGLTKETNDFLRQFSAQGGQAGAGRTPPSGNSIWPDPSKVVPQQKAAP